MIQSKPGLHRFARQSKQAWTVEHFIFHRGLGCALNFSSLDLGRKLFDPLNLHDFSMAPAVVK